MEDKSISGGRSFDPRFILGPRKYDPNLIKTCVGSVGYEMIVIAPRHVNTDDTKNILNFIPENATIIPNTSGARSADEAIKTIRLARETGCGNLVKAEIMRDSKYLLPDNVETLKAMKVLADEGFVAIPYTYPDLNFTRDLKEAGANYIMLSGFPVGSNRGLATRDFTQIIVNEIDLSVTVDAGIGKPSQAYETVEVGVSAIMVNTVTATSGDISKMAEAFALTVKAGRLAYIARPGKVLETGANPSPPLRDFLK